VKPRLLFAEQDLDLVAGLPANRDDLIADLELPTLLDAMSGGDKFLREISERVLLTSLREPEAIRYRQAVLADCVAEPEVIREIYHLAVATLQEKRRAWGLLSAQNPSSILSAAVNQLEILSSGLRRLREIADEHSGTFRSDGLATFFGTLKKELDDRYFETLSRHLRQLRFPGGELMSARLGRDNTGVGYVLRSGRTRRGLKERVGIAPRTVYSFTIALRDDAGAHALAEMVSRGVNHVANAAAQSADHISSYFTMLCAELGFYVSCLNLHDQLTGRDQPIAFPAPAPLESGELSCADLRDPCLALRTSPVVGNDVDADGKSLIVITGANSGGKSTFLRSLGLAELMMQSGLFVTARDFRSSVSHGIFTHFVREEDPAMVSGRLDEELARLSAIADQIGGGCLMLFNESFAATNEREGSEIGRQVVTALLEAGIKVVFVTHHFDLADSLCRQLAHPVLSLRAPRQPDGRRDFKLAPAPPLPTSYGTDIYHRIGGWLGERDSCPD
jgi:hypothetical protein